MVGSPDIVSALICLLLASNLPISSLFIGNDIHSETSMSIPKALAAMGSQATIRVSTVFFFF